MAFSLLLRGRRDVPRSLLSFASEGKMGRMREISSQTNSEPVAVLGDEAASSSVVSRPCSISESAEQHVQNIMYISQSRCYQPASCQVLQPTICFWDSRLVSFSVPQVLLNPQQSQNLWPLSTQLAVALPAPISVPSPDTVYERKPEHFPGVHRKRVQASSRLWLCAQSQFRKMPAPRTWLA